MVTNERDVRHSLVVEAARRMMTAARRSPEAARAAVRTWKTPWADPMGVAGRFRPDAPPYPQREQEDF